MHQFIKKYGLTVKMIQALLKSEEKIDELRKHMVLECLDNKLNIYNVLLYQRFHRF